VEPSRTSSTDYCAATLSVGKIVDFIDYGGFFVGNVADIALVGAAIGSVLLSFFGAPFRTHRAPKAGAETEIAFRPSAISDAAR